jgi:hypothetical protein
MIIWDALDMQKPATVQGAVIVLVDGISGNTKL